jgi:hypothetical protein
MHLAYGRRTGEGCVSPLKKDVSPLNKGARIIHITQDNSKTLSVQSWIRENDNPRVWHKKRPDQKIIKELNLKNQTVCCVDYCVA